MKKILILLGFILICSFAILNADDNVSVIPTDATNKTALELYEPTFIVDMPTAGLLTNMHYSINSQLISRGGFYIDFTAAFFKFLNLSISYGGSGIIGSQPMNLQGLPGFHLKVRLFNETKKMPAVVLGFSSQGNGLWLYHDKNNKRFEQLQPDFYLALSKNFNWALGDLSINAGVNYHLEDTDEQGINIYAGIIQQIFRYTAIALEVNPNLNDGDKSIWGDDNSPIMVNAGLHITPSDNIIIKVQFKDLLRNSLYSNEVGRYFGLSFISRF